MRAGANKYIRYAGIILIVVLSGLAYSQRSAQPVKGNKLVKTKPASNITTAAKTKDCCKVSFSRAKMLGSENVHSVVPANQ